MMYKELLSKLFSGESFKNFCYMGDELRKREHKIDMPLGTATLLYTANIDCVKGDEEIDIIHNRVKNFLYSNRGISKNTSFYDYFDIQILCGLQMERENS